jgi:hypothetical protein
LGDSLLSFVLLVLLDLASSLSFWLVLATVVLLLLAFPFVTLIPVTELALVALAIEKKEKKIQQIFLQLNSQVSSHFISEIFFTIIRSRSDARLGRSRHCCPGGSGRDSGLTRQL